MKHILPLLLALLVGLTSCKQEVIYDLTSRRPIRFSEQVDVTVRGAHLNQLNGRSFGVRGYKYESQWESEQSFAVPDANWKDVRIDCDASGVCTYSPIQFWESKMHYAFFGYYPHTSQSNGAISLSAENVEGTPSLTFRLPDQAVGTQGNQWKGDRTAMHDVMYGHVVDANEIETSSVEFTFKHLLYGIRVVVENFDTAPVEIESLAIKLNLDFRSVTIPMDGTEGMRYGFDPSVSLSTADTTTTVSQSIPVTFEYIKQGDPTLTVPSTINTSPTPVDKANDLMLIPQKAIGGEAIVQVKGHPQKDVIPLNYPNLVIRPGILYQLNVQFIGEQINVIIVHGTVWGDNNSDVEFE